jgi:Holliday junction resolvase
VVSQVQPPFAVSGGETVRAAKKDQNHNEIVAYLEKLGWQTFDTSGLGKGFPDVVVNRAGFTALLEIKRKGGKLTAEQEKFHKSWRGPLVVAESPEEAAEKLLGLTYAQRVLHDFDKRREA